MNILKNIFLTFLSILLWKSAYSYDTSSQDPKRFSLPEAAHRTYAENFKDSALAYCIAMAYKDEPKAYDDAGYSAGGIDNWGNYDIENSTGKVPELVNKYLSKQYNSINGPKVHLNLMKCIDMYHSKELDALVKKYVINPNRTYAQDYPEDDHS